MNALFCMVSTIAVQKGVQTLDKISVQCSATKTAKTCMPTKPIKYGIAFYVVVGHSSFHIHFMHDNKSGNKSGISLA